MHYESVYGAVASKVIDGIAYQNKRIAEQRDREEALRIVRKHFAHPQFNIPSRDNELGRALMFIGELIAEQPEATAQAAE